MSRNIMDIVGSNVAYYRKEKGMTVEKLARRMLIPPAIVREVEAGKRGMNIRTLADYSKVLGVSVVFLVADRGEE